MKHLKSVTVVNDKRSHWVRIPLGASVEWDDIIEDRETSSWLQLKEQTLTTLVSGGLSPHQEIAAQKSKL